MKTLLLSLLFAVPALAQENLTLGLGENQTLRVPPAASIWIQDKDILTAEGHGHSVQIRGRREGSTVLKAGPQLYTIQVVHPAKKSSLRELQKRLEGTVGLKALIADGDLIVEGHLYRLQDWVSLSSYIHDKGLRYQMRAHLSQDLQRQTQGHFKQLFKAAALPPQTVLFDGGAEVRIAAPDLAYKKYQRLLAPYGVQVIRDDSILEVAPTIKVQITVAEIKRDTSLKYGLRWPAGYSAKLMPDDTFQREELTFNLSALEGRGLAKILASPNILCRSGKEAEFLAGGEFPIKIMNYKVQDIVWKRYGILLRVKPRADAAGRMSLSIETEVSTLDASRSVDDIPGILTNRVSSHFDLTSPRTIALSGLLKNEDSQNSEGLPWLSRLPILGALFSSRDFKENRSELVIFVRPSILTEEETDSAPVHLRELRE